MIKPEMQKWGGNLDQDIKDLYFTLPEGYKPNKVYFIKEQWENLEGIYYTEKPGFFRRIWNFFTFWRSL